MFAAMLALPIYMVKFEPSYFSCIADDDDIVDKGFLARTWPPIRIS
jgi:hypothetical protein